MSLLVQKPGILTTIQDLGRRGYRRSGINPGGVMDRTATRLINPILGNDETEAVLEMHFPAPQLLFQANAIIAIGGADLSPEVDGEAVQNWKPIFIKKGSGLRLVDRVAGNRAYLAIKGGLKLDPWLGSSSTNLAVGVGGLAGRKLETGDTLRFIHKTRKPSDLRTVYVSASLRPRYSHFPTVRIIAGAEFPDLTKKGRELLANEDFTIRNNSDRMGFRLAGEPLSLSRPLDLLSSAVSFGTIQLLPDGQLIVLMADHQTAGGYPRIAHVVSSDLPLLAQLGPTDKIAFHLIEPAEAERLAIDFERELSFFHIGCRFQANSWAT